MDQLEVSIRSALDRIGSAIPAMLGALIVLIIGWILAGIAGRVTAAAVRRTGVDRMFAEHGGDQVVPSEASGQIVMWLVRLATLIIAATVLGLAEVSLLVNQIVLWLPNLIVAAIILLVAPVIARFLRSLIEVGAGQAGFSNARILGRIVEVAVVVFAVVIAVNQVGVASSFIVTLFTGIVAAFTIAFGIAFGLGGRGAAEKITDGWYESSRRVADRIAQQVDEPPTDVGRADGTRTTPDGLP
ncbi:hypothetical protein BH20CHL7_BH20CHL7_05730 [soil metagenome]